MGSLDTGPDCPDCYDSGIERATGDPCPCGTNQRFPNPEAEQRYREQARALREALELYRERTTERQDIWKRAGLKGLGFQMMCKAERGFAEVMRGEIPNRDHFLDLINYAGFALRFLDARTGHSPATDATPEVGWRLHDDVILNGDWPW